MPQPFKRRFIVTRRTHLISNPLGELGLASPIWMSVSTENNLEVPQQKFILKKYFFNMNLRLVVWRIYLFLVYRVCNDLNQRMVDKTRDDKACTCRNLRHYENKLKKMNFSNFKVIPVRNQIFNQL